MSHGLRDDDGNPVLSLEGDPWKTFPVKQIRPSKDDYIKEVIRRWNQTNGGSRGRLQLIAIIAIKCLRCNY